MPLTFNDLVQLINSSVVENSTQDITATVMNDILQSLAEYANEHNINDSRISSNIARVSNMNNAIQAASDDLESTIKGSGPLPASAETLTGLYNLIQSISNPTPVDPIPPGMISMWSGDGTVLPTGWALCDGTNGTPDLRGRFVVGYHAGNPSYDQPGNLSVLKFNGSGGTEIAGETGGSPSNTLTKSNIPRHYHEAKGDGATINIGSSGSHSHSTNASIKGEESFRAGVGSWKYLNNYYSSNATTYSSSHTHSNTNFSGKVGHGGSDGLPASPASIENRPPYYTLAYIMKL